MSTTRPGMRLFVVAAALAAGVASCSSSNKGAAVTADSGTTGADSATAAGKDATAGGARDAGKDAANGGSKDATSDGKRDSSFVSHDAGSDCGGRTGNPCGDGAACTTGTDCQSGFCTASVCAAPPPTCTDGAKDGQETDVDCGGTVCAPCDPGKACVRPVDCTSDVCTASVCQSPSPTDGVKNDSETDVDCGGASQADGTANPASDGAPACAVGKACALASDCAQGVCDASPVRAGDAGADAASSTGDAAATVDGGSPLLYCQPASPTDGVKNDSETDVDCGGALLTGGALNPASDGAPPCTIGQKCLLGSDCDQGVCNANAGAGGGPINCPAGASCTCQVPSPTDGVKNDGETDVDCGGGNSPGSDGAPACAPGAHCLVGADCTSLICKATHLCAAPLPTDGVKNDSETDVDCGGAKLAGGASNPASDGAPRCPDDHACAIDEDCLSSFCSLVTKTCVDGQSCKGLVTPAVIMDPIFPQQLDAEGDVIGTPDANGAGQHAGLDTCGQGEATDPPASQKHESCCRSLLLPGSTTTRLDKYEVTAGRLRQFAESMTPPYDIRDWALAQVAANSPVGQVLASQIPTGVAGTANVLKLLPASKNPNDPLNAIQQFGGTVVDPSNAEQGCYTGSNAYGASVYWWGASDLEAVGSPTKPFTQDYYDIKSMNCGLYWVYAAFCAWDGGRLPVITEVEAAYGTAAYPWGAHFLPYDTALNNGSDYPYETLASGQANPNTGQVPNPSYRNVPLINQYAASHHTTPVALTVNWLNGSNVNNGGSFYFYPGYVASDPPGTPDTLSNGLDLTPFIASPGRFFLDVTAAKSSSFAGNEGWQDLGANMLEMRAIAPASVNVPGGSTFCDCTGITTGGGAGCSCLAKSGVTRATGLPNASYDGGSWEGHTSFNPASTANFVLPSASAADWPTWAQYGKIGFRCARPAEPAH